MLRMPRPRRKSRQVPQNDSHLRARTGPMPLHHSMEHTALLESGACRCDKVKIAKKDKSYHVTMTATNNSEIYLSFREQRSSTTFLSAAQHNMSATRRSTATWPSATTSGTRTGGAQSVARETDATTMSRQVAVAEIA